MKYLGLKKTVKISDENREDKKIVKRQKNIMLKKIISLSNTNLSISITKVSQQNL